jgi:hypothetical protein
VKIITHAHNPYSLTILFICVEFRLVYQHSADSVQTNKKRKVHIMHLTICCDYAATATPIEGFHSTFTEQELIWIPGQSVPGGKNPLIEVLENPGHGYFVLPQRSPEGRIHAVSLDGQVMRTFSPGQHRGFVLQCHRLSKPNRGEVRAEKLAIGDVFAVCGHSDSSSLYMVVNRQPAETKIIFALSLTRGKVSEIDHDCMVTPHLMVLDFAPEVKHILTV